MRSDEDNNDNNNNHRKGIVQILTTRVQKPPPQEMDLEQKLMCHNNNHYAYDDESYVGDFGNVDEVAYMALEKERKRRRMPMICRLGYILLFHVVVFKFLSLASEKYGTSKDDDALKSYIRTLSDPNKFENNNTNNATAFLSPQSQAWEYMMTKQQHQSKYYDTSTFTQKDKALIRQDYVLAVLYYSLNGQHWDRNDRWLSDSTTDVCGWYTSYHHNDICNEDGLILVLDLSNNGILGDENHEILQLPIELGHLSEHLKDLDLSRNSIMGTIPTELGLLTNLRRLALYENDFTGSIPTELGVLSDTLETLELNSNHLAGTIPNEMAILTNLVTLLVNDNANLVGTMPLCNFLPTPNINLQHLWADCVDTHDEETELVCDSSCCRCCFKASNKNCEIHHSNH